MNVRKILKHDLVSVINEPWVDHSRRPYCLDIYAYVPVRAGYSYENIIPERKPYNSCGYQKMGDTIIIHGNVPTKQELQELINWEKPTCILHLDGHNGIMRIPNVTILYGKPHDVTFRESGIIYTLNPEKIMFSQGNRGEKQRLRSFIKPGEHVCDMFAGIGYFTLSAASECAYVQAIELNPISYEYLCKNIYINHLEKYITPIMGDCRENMTGIYDRIIMGHFDSIKFLNKALNYATDGTIIHLHGLTNIHDDDNVMQNQIHEAMKKQCFKYTINEYTIKKYSSHLHHHVWDITLE